MLKCGLLLLCGALHESARGGFDKSGPTYLPTEKICSHFGVSESNTGQKATFIEKTLKIGLFDAEYCTRKLAEQNPLRDLVVLNGFIVSKDFLQ